MASTTEPQSQLSAAEQWLKRLNFQWYEDMYLLPGTLKIIPKIKAFDFAEDDILICTYPRSGTTWTQEMTWLVCNNADTDGARATDLETRCPFVEYTEPHLGKPNIDILEKRAPPRIVKTHLRPQLFENRKCKTILTMRNVKDAAVSFYHICKNIFDFPGDWNDFFELFKQDKIYYGSWLKHVLQCWELRDDPNVLLLKYEDIKKDHIGTVRKIADFCGKTLTEEQMAAIADYTMVGNMKKVYESSGRVKNNTNYTSFIRKGAVGEWNKYFSKEQLEYVEGLLKEAEKEGLFFEDKLD